MLKPAIPHVGMSLTLCPLYVYVCVCVRMGVPSANQCDRDWFG